MFTLYNYLFKIYFFQKLEKRYCLEIYNLKKHLRDEFRLKLLY